MEKTYIVVSIADNLCGNWVGNHTIIADNCSLEQVQGYLEDEHFANKEARYLGFDKAGCNTLSYMTMEEYDRECAAVLEDYNW